MPRIPEALQQTIEAIQSGRRDDAEQLASQLEEKNQRHHITLAPGYLLAESDLSRMYTALGRFDDAILTLRRALSIPRTPTREDLLCKLQTNLAELLLHAGRTEEARSVHQDGLNRRIALYGKNSLGAAMGEAPCAEFLFMTGELKEAEQLAGVAMASCLRAKAPQVAPVIALRAAIRAARYHDERPLLESFRLLTGAPRRELIRECLHRATRDEPRLTRLVLDELRERLEDSNEELESSSITTTLRKANSALGDYRRSAELIEWQLQRLKDEAQILGALLSLALEKSEAGDFVGASGALQTAKQQASRLDLASQIRVLRNEGRIQIKRGNIQAAETSFQSAVQLGETSGGALLGSALVGRALLAHHHQEKTIAERLFTRALTLLPPTHHDALIASEHLQALALRVDCDCALALRVEREVRTRIPLEILSRIVVRHSPAKRLHAEFLSPPTQQEKTTVEQVIRQVIKT
jgi:tetratricopeptide (TPR) repeat protein